jgi:SAM-dependent methyltransferase
MPGPAADDAYGGISYQDLIDWPRRLARESPFLERELARAPERSVLDAGCGPGEHARHFASLGFRTLGVDRSAAMLEKARERPLPENLSFVEADLATLGEAVSGRFGAAVSLGNTLPHIESEEALSEVFRGIASRLLPGGLFIAQILNYERIASQKIRHLPLNILPFRGGEIVFLRFMETEAGGFVRFCPTVLRYRSDRDPPLEMIESRLIRLRGWRPQEIVRALGRAGFEEIRLHGDMTGGDFDPAHSTDVVAVALLPPGRR